jgi:hypothetical protein
LVCPVANGRQLKSRIDGASCNKQHTHTHTRFEIERPPCACEGCTPAVQAGSRIVLLGCTATANVVRAVLSATLPFVSILQPHQDRTGRFPHLLCRSLPPLHFHVFSPEGTLSVCLSSLLKWGSLVLPSLVRVRCALSFRRFVCSVAACSPQCNTSSGGALLLLGGYWIGVPGCHWSAAYGLKQQTPCNYYYPAAPESAYPALQHLDHALYCPSFVPDRF